jgi:uncharacterized membrane protein
MDSYVYWKTAHIISATILMGTGVGIAFFCWFGSRAAIRDRNIVALRMVLRFTVLADALFTAPAVVVQAVTGAMLMSLAGWPWISPWSVGTIGLFGLVGACWLPVVWIQWRMKKLADHALDSDTLPQMFTSLFRAWMLLGIPALAAMLTLMFMMVAKPLAVM